MLVLQRKQGTRFTVGEAVIVIQKIKGNTVHVAIDAPPSVRIVRDDAKKADKVDPVKNQEWEAE